MDRKQWDGWTWTGLLWFKEEQYRTAASTILIDMAPKIQGISGLHDELLAD